MFKWLLSRVAVIYAVMFVFSLTCMDLKMLEMRIKVRHLNDAIPNFSNMVVFSKDQNAKNDFDWKAYKDYFQLIYRYIPKDPIVKQLLGYVDANTGQEQEAIALFKDSAVMNGKFLFWSNYNLGVIYYKKGMWPQAAQYLLSAVTSNPKLSVFLMENSLVYKQIFISPYFKYSLPNEMKDAQSHAYILLLSSLYHLKQYDKMIVISNACIADQGLPYKDAFYYYLGLAFLEMGQPKNAFLLFQESLKIEKDNPDVYYYIANIYQSAGQLEQARDLLQASYLLHQKNDPRFPYETHVNLRFF